MDNKLLKPGSSFRPRDILERSAVFCDRCIQVALRLTENGVCWANTEEAQWTTGAVFHK